MQILKTVTLIIYFLGIFKQSRKDCAKIHKIKKSEIR